MVILPIEKNPDRNTVSQTQALNFLKYFQARNAYNNPDETI